MSFWNGNRSRVLLLLIGASCADDKTHFDVRYAPGFERHGVSISILGVFKDGRLSPDAWDEVLPKLSPALGSNPCPAAFGPALFRSNAAFAEAVDDYTMANGMTDELLGEFAPAAKGDLILTLVTAGASTLAGDAGPPPSSTPQPPPQMRTRGGRGRGGRGPSPGSPEHARSPDRGGLELSASLYSVRLHRSVALLSMTYSGRQLDEAIVNFRQELAKEFPGATCAGWNWDVELDPDHVRNLGER